MATSSLEKDVFKVDAKKLQEILNSEPTYKLDIERLERKMAENEIRLKEFYKSQGMVIK